MRNRERGIGNREWLCARPFARMSLRKISSALLVSGALLCVAQAAHATVVERVVAVVGERAILMSELRQRARPFLIEIHQKAPGDAQKAAAESELFRQMLDRMIDDQLEAQAASKLRIKVSAEEIDSAIERLAGMQDMSVERLMGEVMRSGMTAQEYRNEIRRQLLEGKLLELRVKGQVRVTEEDMRTMFERLRRDERRFLGYKAQWIVLRIPEQADQATRTKRRMLAEQLAADARAGGDFGAMAKKHSDDTRTRVRGGNLGHLEPGELDVPIERVAFSMEVGEISAPFRYADAIVLIRVNERDTSKLGTFDEMRDRLAQRVYADKLETAKRRWLDALKRGVHIDVRL